MEPRIKTELWVQAFLRRCAVAGLFGAVLKRGHSDAGSVIVVVNHLDGTHSLLTPAPGPAYDDAGERRFENLSPRAMTWEDVRTKLAKATSFDSDLWVIEIEDRKGLGSITPINS
jgi:hypothetical protein